jgi:hypothetical protein
MNPAQDMSKPDRIIAVFALWLCFITPALAYIDPGTGMMLLQALIAAVGAVWIVVGRPFRWLSRKIKSLRRRDAGP